MNKLNNSLIYLRSLFFVTSFTFLLLISHLFAGIAYSAERDLTLKTGQTKNYTFKYEVNNSKITIKDRSIAKAIFKDGRFKIKGLMPGSTEVTFSGQYRSIEVGKKLKDEDKSFSHTFHLTVLKSDSADVKTLKAKFSVAKGRSKTYALSILLGPKFKKGHWKLKKVQSRKVGKRGGDIKITVIRDKNKRPIKIKFTGVKKGKVKIKLSGRSRYHNTWRKGVRYMNMRVRAN